MNRRLLAAVGAVALVLGATAGIKVIRAGTPADGKHYGHVFVIMMENTGYRSLIGNPNAPWVNRAVATYGAEVYTHPTASGAANQGQSVPGPRSRHSAGRRHQCDHFSNDSLLPKWSFPKAASIEFQIPSAISPS